MNSASEQTTAMHLLDMSRFEWRIGSRTLAWRLFSALFFVYGISLGHVDGVIAGGAAYTTAGAGWRLVSFAAIIWMAVLGARETTLRTKTIVFVKPQPIERIALAWFIGAMAQVTVFLISLFAGSILARIIAGSPPTMLVVYVPQFVRAFAVVFFVSALSFTMALLSDNVSAGMLVCLYVVLVMAGKAFLPKLLDPSLVQNNGAYIAFGLAILCLGLRFYGRKRRGSAPPPAWISSAGFAFFGLTAWFFYVICIDGHDPHIHEDRALNAMQTQDTSVGLRAAGYLLPDQDGKLSGLAQFSGSIYVIALWSPNDPDCDQLLGRLNAVQAKLRNVGVQVVAVCLSDDNSAARTFAKGDNLLFPVVTDWGTVDVPEKLAMSPIASAYRTSILPMVAVTDRRRRIVDIMRGTTCYDGHTMNDTIQTVISKDH